MSPPELSILIVSYNTCAITLACLESVYAETRDLSFEVIAVDNASADESAKAIRERFPGVILHESPTNLGFAAANNLAAQLARGRYLLLLNPDTVVLDGAVQKLHRFALAHPEAGIVGGRTLFADGGLNPTSCRGRPTPWSLLCRGLGLSTLFRGSLLFDPESLGPWRRDSAREVDIVTGCLLWISRALWQELGGFDPAFFMYGEESDLCLRARTRGFRPMITPDATIIHLGGASEPVRTDKMVRLLGALVLLVRRHWPTRSARFGVAMLWLWAATRALGARALPSALLQRSEGGSAWPEVFARRAEWLRPRAGSQRPAREAASG